MIILRGGASRLEVLLVKRNPAQRFMGGAWVFPGGAVDADDGEGDRRRTAPPACARSPRRPASRCRTRTRSCGSRAGSRRRGRDPLRHALLPRRRCPRRDARIGRRASASTSAGSRHRARSTRTGARDRCSSSRRSSTSSRWPAFAHADALLAWARGRASSRSSRAWSEGETARVVLPGDPGYVTSPKASGDEGARSPGRRKPC